MSFVVINADYVISDDYINKVKVRIKQDIVLLIVEGGWGRLEVRMDGQKLEFGEGVARVGGIFEQPSDKRLSSVKELNELQIRTSKG